MVKSETISTSGIDNNLNNLAKRFQSDCDGVHIFGFPTYHASLANGKKRWNSMISFAYASTIRSYSKVHLFNYCWHLKMGRRAPRITNKHNSTGPGSGHYRFEITFLFIQLRFQSEITFLSLFFVYWVCCLLMGTCECVILLSLYFFFYLPLPLSLGRTLFLSLHLIPSRTHESAQTKVRSISSGYIFSAMRDFHRFECPDFDWD